MCFYREMKKKGLQSFIKYCFEKFKSEQAVGAYFGISSSGHGKL